MPNRWQLQEAKQRFSELVRAVGEDGPQYVTRHGQEVVVVIDVEEYERLKRSGTDFKEFLRSAPELDELEIERSAAPARAVAFGDPG